MLKVAVRSTEGIWRCWRKKCASMYSACCAKLTVGDLSRPHKEATKVAKTPAGSARRLLVRLGGGADLAAMSYAAKRE